jgi:inward rectifier potassium channel
VSATPPPTLTSRIVSRVGEESIVREGYGRIQRDAYHYLVEASWPRLLLILLGLYLTVNSIFAGAYLLQPHSIGHARPDSFLDAFFFSVQTMATIGYGTLVPRTRYANVLVVLETSVGILGLAMITGIIFSKFSRPTARVLFSQRAIVTRRDGMPCLLFRMANARATQIVDAQATVLLARSETTLEGEGVRRFYDLELSRQRNPIFALTWTAIHFIDEASPLYGATPRSSRRSSGSTRACPRRCMRATRISPTRSPGAGASPTSSPACPTAGAGSICRASTTSSTTRRACRRG